MSDLDSFKPVRITISICFGLMLFITIALPYFQNELDKLPTCTSPIIHTCYRYESAGGLFGGTNVYETSCNNPHDYYTNVSSNQINCKPIYIKGYD